MGKFLNSIVPFEAYKSVAADTYFVDKTELIEDLIPALGKEQRFICITRPRRFGKSVMANMVGAYFGKTMNSGSLFDNLYIAKSKNYALHRNKYNIIFIDFSKNPRDCNAYSQYITRIQDELNKDLAEAYTDLAIDIDHSVWDNLQLIFEHTMTKFIFIMDEWDAVFHMPYISEKDHKEYLMFLRDLLKGQAYVELAYMTGVLPIAKYSSGSELNMFVEYDMVFAEKFGAYFGFEDNEVDALYEIYQKTTKSIRISREDLRKWYDGYYTFQGSRLYNPRSIVLALSDNQLRNYWTRSGPYDEIFYYIKNNIEDVKDDLVYMVAGEGVEADIQEYAADSMKLESKDQIYSAMVVYGLLTYTEGKVYIPNREIMEQFRRLLMTKESLGYVYRLAKASEKMLKATLAKDTRTMVEILKFAHDTESPIFAYNSEIELSAVVNLVYLAARDMYRIEREDKAGEGFVDFIFYPVRRNADAVILELKVNHTPEEAIAQIIKKNYKFRLQGKLGEEPKYTGRILAVGISYNKETKEHYCKVEELYTDKR